MNMNLLKLLRRKPVYVCGECKKRKFTVKLTKGEKCPNCGQEMEWDGQ